MTKFLKLYLLITGILALLALAIPSLVFIGFFLLFIPGLILSLAPTAFMWGLLFAIIWWLLRSILGSSIAAFAAIPIAVTILWAIPQPSIKAANLALKRHALSNITPDRQITLYGDVRIETQFTRWDNANPNKLGFRTYSCDNRCLALLFEPGVRSVTITKISGLSFADLRDGVSQTDRYSRTYRLVSKSKCRNTALTPDLEERIGQFGETIEDNRAIALEWGERLTSEYCLVGDKPLEKFDFLLRTGNWESGDISKARRSSWSIPVGDASSYFSEIRTGDQKILFRLFNLQTWSLSVPFMIGWNGGSQNFSFGWFKQSLPQNVDSNWETPVKALDAILDVQRTADMENALNKARSAIAMALDDQSLDSNNTAFKSVPDYAALLAKTDPAPEDFDLIKRLIMDERLDDFDGAWILPTIFSREQLDELLPTIISKLGDLPDNANPKAGLLGSKLDIWPEGMFANPDEATLALLRDPIRRRRATGLISRLSDMGSSGAPLLASILEYHLKAAASFNSRDSNLNESEKYGGYPAHKAAASAAVTGMCLLGQKAKSELPKMLEIERDFERYRIDRRNWDRMIARIGKPIDNIQKPNNMSGTQANYRKNLYDWLNRFDPKKSCR